MEESTGNESTANQATETVSAPATTPASTKKSWEHPWTVAEIRKQAGQWSLAADVGLLRHMKEFASLLTTQAHEVSVEVSQLVHDTKLTDAKIETVTDYFLTLSDSQFIENRVYDEDDTLDKKEENEKKVESKKVKTREEREAELLPRLKESVQFGLKVIEDAYDVLDIKAIDSDSEDEDEDNTLLSKEIILEPKDPYVTRPLPYLIGSRNFINEDDVGVGDLPSSDEAESEAGSMSESDEEIEKPATVSDVSTSDYDSDLSEESDMEQTPVTGKNALTMTSSDDDLSSSEDDDELSEEEIKHPAKVEAKTEVHAHPSTKKKRGKSKRASENNDIFGEEEAEDDLFAANDGLFGKGGGLFSKPKGGLFDGVEDFDDDESLSGSSSQEEEKEPVENIKPKAKSKPAAPQGGISLFGGAISKGFFKGQEEPDQSDDEQDPINVTPSKPKSKGIFDESDSDDEDLFAIESKSEKILTGSSSKTSPKAPAKSEGLFENSDDDKDLFKDASDEEDVKGEVIQPPKESSSKFKPPVGGVSMFGGGGGALQEALNKVSKRRQSSSTESDDDSGLFDSKPPSLPKSGGSSSTASRTSSKASLPAPSKVSSNSLQSKGKSSQRGLFDDDSDDEALKGGTISKPRKSVPIAKSKPATSKKKGLFDDSGSDEDLFSGMKSSTTRSSKPSVQNSKPEKKEDSLQKKKETTKEVDVVTSKPTVATKPKKDLFDTESEDEHLFSSSSKNTSKDAPLFDGDENDGGLERDDQSVKEEEEVPKRKKLAGAVSMFGAGGGELLAAVSKRRSTSQISNTSNKGDKVSEGTSNSNKQHTTDTEVSAGSKDALFDDKSPSSTAPVITNVVAKPFSLTSTSKSQPVLTKVTAPTSKSNIGKLQANLAINPSALLPGAAPKIVSSVDVDAPLETATKTRSRGQAGRRPPSRHARRKVAQNAAGDVFTSVSSDIATTSPPSENLIKSPVNPKVESIPGEEKAAAKHDDNLDDWLAAPKDKPAKNIKTVAPKKKTQLPDIFGDDEDDFLKVSKPSSKTKKESLFDDDLLFGSVVKPIASDTSKPPSKPDDDFFKTELDFKSDTTSSLFDESKTSSSKKKKHNLFADDLFADLDSDLTSKSKKSGDSKKTNNIKFDDDEDIFGDIGSEATKEKQKKVAEKPKATSKLEEIDGDDLFGDVSPVVSTKKKETKPANAPKLDLFDDDADIFGDLTAPKTKSKKKATKKAAEDSSIFDDDDIFSSTTATKTPSTKKSKKTKSAKSKATTKAEDDIFEDPLSALLGP